MGIVIKMKDFITEHRLIKSGWKKLGNIWTSQQYIASNTDDAEAIQRSIELSRNHDDQKESF